MSNSSDSEAGPDLCSLTFSPKLILLILLEQVLTFKVLGGGVSPNGLGGGKKVMAHR